jgi:hypothetical protein
MNIGNVALLIRYDVGLPPGIVNGHGISVAMTNYVEAGNILLHTVIIVAHGDVRHANMNVVVYIMVGPPYNQSIIGALIIEGDAKVNSLLGRAGTVGYRQDIRRE